MDAIVIIREYDPSDEAYIYSAWRNNSYYSAVKKPEGAPSAFFTRQSQKIKKILEKALIKIACFQDTPTVIVGYSVSTGTNLDWIFVKPDYRLKGIGKLLMPKDIKTVSKEDLTKIGRNIVEKKNLKFKGEENGRNRQENQSL